MLILAALLVSTAPCDPQRRGSCTDPELVALCDGSGPKAATACFVLGKDLVYVARPDQKLPLLDRACKLGVVDACYLAYELRFIRRDDGFRRGDEKSERAACEAGNNKACGYLSHAPNAQCTAGLPFACPVEELKRACSKDGFGAAEKCLSYVGMKMDRASSSDAERAPLLERACAQGAQLACFERGLDRLYDTPDVGVLVRDLTGASESLRKGCTVTPSRAQMYPVDPTEDHRSYCAQVQELDAATVACMSGTAAACMHGAKLLAVDGGVGEPNAISPSDGEARRALLARACTLGEKSACKDATPPRVWTPRKK